MSSLTDTFRKIRENNDSYNQATGRSNQPVANYNTPNNSANQNKTRINGNASLTNAFSKIRAGNATANSFISGQAASNRRSTLLSRTDNFLTQSNSDYVKGNWNAPKWYAEYNSLMKEIDEYADTMEPGQANALRVALRNAKDRMAPERTEIRGYNSFPIATGDPVNPYKMVNSQGRGTSVITDINDFTDHTPKAPDILDPVQRKYGPQFIRNAVADRLIQNEAALREMDYYISKGASLDQYSDNQLRSISALSDFYLNLPYYQQLTRAGLKAAQQEEYKQLSNDSERREYLLENGVPAEKVDKLLSIQYKDPNQMSALWDTSYAPDQIMHDQDNRTSSISLDSLPSTSPVVQKTESTSPAINGKRYSTDEYRKDVLGITKQYGTGPASDSIVRVNDDYLREDAGLNDDQITHLKQLGTEDEVKSYLIDIGMSDGVIREILEGTYEDQAEITPAEENPLADNRIFRGAVSNVQNELDNRNFLRQYLPLTQNEDFQDNSSHYEIDSRFIPDYRDVQAYRDLTDEDKRGLFIASMNGNEKAYDLLHYTVGPNGEKQEYSNVYDEYGGQNEEFMTKDEVAIFNYLHNTQGIDAAMQYYRELDERYLQARAAQEVNKEYQEWTKQDPVGANFATTLFKPFVAFGSAAQQIYDLATTGHINADSSAYAYLNAPQTVRGTTTQMINDSTGNEWGSQIFNAGMSVIDNIYGIALGGGISNAFGLTGEAQYAAQEAITLLIMGTDVAQTTTLDGIRNGMAEDEAILNGFAAGAIEVLTEKIGLDNLFGSLARGRNGFITFATQALSEGAEEGLSHELNNAWGAIYDNLTGRDLSDWQRKMNVYILEHGLAPNQQKEAFNAVYQEDLKELGYDVMGGLMSGGVMGGPVAVNNSIQNRDAVRDVLNTYKTDAYGNEFDLSGLADDTEALRALANEGMHYDVDSTVHKKAYGVLSAVNTGQKVSQRQAEALYNELLKIEAGFTKGAYAGPNLWDVHRLAVNAAERSIRNQQNKDTLNKAINEAIQNGGDPSTIPSEIRNYVENSGPITDSLINALGKDTIRELNTIAEETANAKKERERGSRSDTEAETENYILPNDSTGQEQNESERQQAGINYQTPSVSSMVADNYENNGRSSFANALRSLNNNGEIPDHIFLEEMTAVYDAVTYGRKIPPTTALNENMIESARIAALTDQMLINARVNSTQETSAADANVQTDSIDSNEEWFDNEEEQNNNDIEQERENRLQDYYDLVSDETFEDVENTPAIKGVADQIYAAAEGGRSLDTVEIPEEAGRYFNKRALSNFDQTVAERLYSAAVESVNALRAAEEQATRRKVDRTVAAENETNVSDQAAQEQIESGYDIVTDYISEASNEKADHFAETVYDNYDDSMDAISYVNGVDSIYRQAQDGALEQDIVLPEESRKYIPDELKTAIYNAALEDINGGSTYGETRQRNVPVLGSSERVNRPSAGIEGQRMAGRTGSAESTGRITEGYRGPEAAYRGAHEGNVTGAETAVNGRYSYHPTGRVATSVSLGLESGTTNNQVQIVELDDVPGNKGVLEIAKQHGKKLVLFAGNNLSFEGQRYGSRGVIQGDTIYVRADHPVYSADQIALHEVTHGDLRTNKNHKISEIVKRLDAIFDAGFVMNKLLPAYRNAYRRADMGDLQVLEEIVCDVRGRMNIFQSMAENLPATAEAYNRFLKEGSRIVDDTIESIQEADQSAKESNAPPKYSADPNASQKQKIIDYIDAVIQDPTHYRKPIDVIKHLSGALANDIKKVVGFDVNGWKVVFAPDEITHSNKRHGKNGKTDHSMANTSEYQYIVDMESTYSVVKEGNRDSRKYRNSDGSRAKQVEISIPKGKGTYYIIEAVPNTSAETIQIVSVYQTKEAVSQVPNANYGPGQNVQNVLASTASNKTVPQPSNSGNQNHSEELTDYTNITPQSVTKTHTPVEIDHGKQTFNDIAFSLEFASDLQAKQRKKLAETKAFDIDTIFEDAVRKTNQMVQTMIQYKEILPTDKVGKVLVKNGSYDYSVENTTICLRTLAYNQFVDMVQDKLDRPLTQMESFLVSQKLYDIAVDPQCLYCYVSLYRKAYNEFLNRYIDDRDDAIRKYEAAGKPDIKTITKTSPLFEDFLHGRKATDNMLGRYRSWIQAYNNGEHLLTKSDIKTDMKRSGITQNGTATEKAQLKDILAYAQSASWSKKQMDYVAYNGEILKMSPRTVNKLNSHYGLRFYSFSDYSGAFIVENMQQVMDASIRGLKGLAYTKDVDFARIFADTGMNINISVFAKFNPETEQYEIDPLQSADINDAIALRNEKPNVGIVVVATDADGVRWAMHQEWSDVVIPFHTVRTGKDVADFYNWTVFTESQNDTVNPAKQNLWDAYVKSTGKKEKNVSRMIYPNEHQNNYDTYMKLINDRGLTPRFDEFRFDENGNVDPTYMKLVNETRQPAGDTQPMIPNFDLAAAEESFRKFVDKGGYYGGWYNEGVNVDVEAQTVANDIAAGKTANDVDYGRQDVSYEDVAKSRKTNRQHARFSEELDSEGNQLTEAQHEYFKDSKVRDKNGNLQMVYHGSPSTDITEFDRNRAGEHTQAYSDQMIWFTDDQQFANDFSYEFANGSSEFTYTRGNKGRVYPGYLNITKPFDLTHPTAEIRDYLEKHADPETIDRLFKIGNHQLLKQYIDYTELQDLGYDGIIAKTDVRGKTLEYGVLDSNQFKSYDNQNPTQSPDIRFSEESDPDAHFDRNMESIAKDLRKRVRQLERENRNLQRNYEYSQAQSELTAYTPESKAWRNMKSIISENDARAIAKNLIQTYGSTINADDIVTDIQYWTTYLHTGRSNAFDRVNRGLLGVAHKLVENAKAIVDSDGTEILKDIKQTKIRISPKTAGDIQDYNEWRKAHFGKMTVSTTSGTDITELYNDLNERYGNLFPADILNASDQLMFIADFVDNFVPESQNPYSYDIAAATQAAALDLYNALTEAPVDQPTQADVRAGEAISRVQKKADASKQKALEAAKKRTDKRIERMRDANKQRMQSLQKRAAESRDKQIQKLKDHYKEQAQNRKARKEEADARKKLLRLVQRMNRIKTTKANRMLIDELIGELDKVAMSLSNGKAQKLLELQEWYENEKLNNPDFVAHEDLIQRELARLNQRRIKDMTLDDVINLTKALQTLENDIRTQNKLIAAQNNQDVFHAGVQIMRDIENSFGTRKGLQRELDNLIIQRTLSPTRFAHRLTGYVESDPLYQAVSGEDGLAGGQRKMLTYQYQAGQLFQEWLSDKKFMKWMTGSKSEILTYDVVTADGKSQRIQITPGMRMLLYLASKDQGWLMHMCGEDTINGHRDGGGITLPNIEDYRKGKITNAYDDSRTVKITRSFLTNMAMDMTDKERAFADAIHAYFNGMSKDAINEVSEQLLGRSIAEVGDYLPISVDKNFLGKEYGAIKYDGTIEGMGNLKDRQNSKKPVMIRDITDVLKQSIASTSKYYGLAIPIRNFNKLMGVTVGHYDKEGQYRNFEGSVLQTISKKWGSKAQKYIENMISDLQMPNVSQDDLEKTFAKIRSNYAGAVLVWNLSVAMKQAASYPTAAAVLGGKALARAMLDFGKVDLDLIAKYTPLQWYRTQGFSTTELGDIQNQNNFFANLPKGLNWIQFVDVITTRKLWKAAEYYVQDNNPELYKKGAGIYGQSDAYYKAVADIYNQVIEETQPNYTALQRPDYLRSKSGITQTLMMFKTQPMQNFNILYDAIGDFRSKRAQYMNDPTNAEIQAQYKAAGKKLRRAITSQIAQLITFAAMTMLWNMIRRKREKYTDEEGNFSIEVMAQNMGKDVGSGLFGMLPFGADAWSLISSIAFGDQYYGFESVTDSALGDLGNAVMKAWNLGGTLIESIKEGESFDLTAQKKNLKSIAFAASKIFGVPVENVWNLGTAAYKRLGRDILEDKYHADYWAIAWDDDPGQKKNEISEILFQAFSDGDIEAFEDLRQILIDSGEWGTDATSPEQDVDKKVQKRWIEHTTGGNTEQDAFNYLANLEGEEYQKVYDQMINLGFDPDKIKKGITNSKVSDITGTSSEGKELYPALYTQYQDDQQGFVSQIQQMIEAGVSEETIQSGMKKAYGSIVTGLDYNDVTVADVYQYLYELYKTNQKAYKEAYQQMIDMGFTEQAIKNGIEAIMKQEQGVDNVKNLKKRFEGPHYKAPSWWTTVEQKEAQEKAEKRLPKGQNETSAKPAKQKTTVETPESSWIGSIDYDEDTQTLTVTTKGGRTYTHSGVSKETFEEFKNSPSKGKWYNSHF